MKLIRKNITKRDHKLIDFDRHNNSLTKLRDKKEKTLNDEKNLLKVEQDYEQASSEYETYNTALKSDMPTFMQLATQFIDPLFHSFYYMQLNIFYLMLEKLQSFCEKKYDTTGTNQDTLNIYEEKRGDARERIEALGITKKFITPRTLHPGSGLGSSGLSRATSTATSGSSSSYVPPSRASTVTSNSKFGSLAAKKGFAPPPPPPSSAAPPPAYSSSGHASNSFVASASALAAKKSPPPPPPVKPKPVLAPKPVVYVTALYDFEAQAEGDLSFRTGDRIEIVQKSESAEDWWTGRLNGQQGVFPGNYVQS